jgi:hypothetical protein
MQTIAQGPITKLAQVRRTKHEQNLKKAVSIIIISLIVF